MQHSPTKIDSNESRRESSQTKENFGGGALQRTDSDSSLEIPFSVMDNLETKYNDLADVPYYHRPNIASEPLGIPSLPDFVQDHILVEQVYLNSNGPITLDVEKLPDFTFNTNFDSGASNSGRRNNVIYNAQRDYDYEGAASEAGAGWCPSLDLPLGAAAGGSSDGPHLNLDLTESVNPNDRRNASPRNNFPLDLPSNAGKLI